MIETLTINDIRDMPRVNVINHLARFVPDNQFKRIEFLKMDTDVLKELLTCYVNPRASLSPKSQTVIMKLGEKYAAVAHKVTRAVATKKVAVKKATKKK